jgi:hypothetical protein
MAVKTIGILHNLWYTALFVYPQEILRRHVGWSGPGVERPSPGLNRFQKPRGGKIAVGH